MSRGVLHFCSCHRFRKRFSPTAGLQLQFEFEDPVFTKKRKGRRRRRGQEKDKRIKTKENPNGYNKKSFMKKQGERIITIFLSIYIDEEGGFFNRVMVVVVTRKGETS